MKAEGIAFFTAMAGLLLATVFYGWRWLDAAEVAQQFRPLYLFLLNKWYFDELYQAIFVAPVMFISRRVSPVRQGTDRSLPRRPGRLDAASCRWPTT